LTFILMNSCQNVEIEPDENNLNTFSMLLNGKIWTPSKIDSCTKTFQCNMSSLNSDNIYKIYAYKDPLLNASLESENFFEIQIMKVNSVGTYFINGEFRNFESYSRLTINEIAGKKRYQNKKDGSSFKVEVTEIFPNMESNIKGIKGTFSGFLFNLDNVKDSIKIERGSFIFKKLNFYNFNQCKE